MSETQMRNSTEFWRSFDHPGTRILNYPRKKILHDTHQAKVNLRAVRSDPCSLLHQILLLRGLKELKDQTNNSKMPTKYGSPTVGRDVDTQWVQLLARRKTPIASPPSSSTPVPMPSATLHDSGPLHSRSTATSYFALLSAAQGQQQPRRQDRPQTPSPSMDSSWGTWLFDRGP
ncbi:unnamed protein product [Penicillium palitans]